MSLVDMFGQSAIGVGVAGSGVPVEAYTGLGDIKQFYPQADNINTPNLPVGTKSDTSRGIWAFCEPASNGWILTLNQRQYICDDLEQLAQQLIGVIRANKIGE